MSAEPRNVVYIIDGTGRGPESLAATNPKQGRACQLGNILFNSLNKESEEALEVQPVFFCKDIVKHNARWNEFQKRAGFVFLHRNNRQIMTPGSAWLNEEPASYDEIVRCCESLKIPLVYYTGDYFWSETTGRPLGFDKKLMSASNSLLVSYGQFLEQSAHKLIQLWQCDRWNVKAAARLIEQGIHRNIQNPLLSLAGCDLLVQGYLLIWKDAHPLNLTLNDLRFAPEAIHKARTVTLPTRLAGRDQVEWSKESFWFADCKNEIESGFCSDADANLQTLIETFLPPYSPEKWIIRCLHSSYSRDAGQTWWHLPQNVKADTPGALRLLVEIIKGKDTAFLEAAGWPYGFETDPGVTDRQGAILQLMSYAHKEFVRAWHDLQALSRSDLNSFESTRNELHHDKLKNEFLFAVAYEPDEVGNKTRHQIMQDAINGDESSLRLLKRGSELWWNLGPMLTDFFNSLSRRYGFVVSDHYKESKDNAKEAVSTIGVIMEKIETGKIVEQDIDIFWDAADRIRLFLSDLAISRRFGDYVIDIDSRLIEENKSA